jgi:hypothetical protein
MYVSFLPLFTQVISKLWLFLESNTTAPIIARITTVIAVIEQNIPNRKSSVVMFFIILCVLPQLHDMNAAAVGLSTLVVLVQYV